MKKILLLTIFALLLMSLSSLATDTRVLTMGENNTILLDDANIWLFPSRINNYPDLAFAEVSYGRYKNDKQYGDYTDPITRFGINWKFGGDKPWVLGTYFHNNDYYDEFPYGEQDIIPTWSVMPWHGPYNGAYEEQSYSNRRMDLFWGYLLGENLLGLHIGYVHSSYQDEDVEQYASPGVSLDERGFNKYDFGIGLTMMEGKLDLAAGIEMFSFTYKSTGDENPSGEPQYVAYDEYKPEGNTLFSLRGRYFYEYNPTYTFVPHAEVMFGKFEYGWYYWNVDHDTLVYTTKYNWTSFDIGVGMHYVPTNNVLGVIDVGFMYVNLKEEYTLEPVDPTQTDEYKWGYTVLPYLKLGMEADVFKWLDVRFGATSYWTKYSYENTLYDLGTEKYTEKYPFNNTYLGLGFNFNRLHVDCYVDPELFMDGFYFISGVDSKERGMNFKISALYEMF
ncbi:MAG: hypothetical protein JXA92_04610 [candidate division Zixibacteria bacterium]|nr:hypothetical protein [candidate division Zixibacteria bacterium]